jgi:predicted 3-demethylubiquinone-9 3-methyltransferase (glyoxalase superfamily)
MAITPRSITPYLWFKENAEDAAKFYVSLFEGSKVGEIFRQDGKALTVNFSLAGQDFIALNGGPDFTFNEAFSVFVLVDTQQQVDELWKKLTANGGEESFCGWLKDRYGLSWQIIPKTLLDRLSDKDAVKAKRAMDAMLQMRKIDIAALERAYAGR